MGIDEKEQQGVPSDLGSQAGPTHSLYVRMQHPWHRRPETAAVHAMVHDAARAGGPMSGGAPARSSTFGPLVTTRIRGRLGKQQHDNIPSHQPATAVSATRPPASPDNMDN
ncbi:hypothetical protein E4U36_000909 [Claviceps purpurea]|nr:hypothetical protein E4U36_000909 [Claviceps purpurea]